MGQEIFSILLVDDEKNERKGIEKLIQKNGYPPVSYTHLTLPTN